MCILEGYEEVYEDYPRYRKAKGLTSSVRVFIYKQSYLLCASPDPQSEIRCEKVK